MEAGRSAADALEIEPAELATVVSDLCAVIGGRDLISSTRSGGSLPGKPW
jgi:hypothetical protein